MATKQRVFVGVLFLLASAGGSAGCLDCSGCGDEATEGGGGGASYETAARDKRTWRALEFIEAASARIPDMELPPDPIDAVVRVIDIPNGFQRLSSIWNRLRPGTLPADPMGAIGDMIRRILMVENLEWLRQDAPAFLMLVHASLLADGSVLVLPVTSREDLVGALPPSLVSEVPGHDLSVAASLTLYLDFSRDYVVVSGDDRVWGEIRDYVSRSLLPWKSPLAVSGVVSIQNLISQDPGRAARPAESDMEAILKWLMNNIGAISFGLETTKDLQDLTLSFRLDSLEASQLASIAQHTQGRTIEMRDSVPEAPWVSVAANVHPNELKPVVDYLIESVTTRLAEHLELLEDEQAHIEELMTTIVGTASGEVFASIHREKDWPYAITAGLSVDDARAVREAQQELFDMLLQIVIVDMGLDQQDSPFGDKPIKDFDDLLEAVNERLGGMTFAVGHEVGATIVDRVDITAAPEGVRAGFEKKVAERQAQGGRLAPEDEPAAGAEGKDPGLGDEVAEDIALLDRIGESGQLAQALRDDRWAIALGSGAADWARDVVEASKRRVTPEVDPPVAGGECLRVTIRPRAAAEEVRKTSAGEQSPIGFRFAMLSAKANIILRAGSDGRAAVGTLELPFEFLEALVDAFATMSPPKFQPGIPSGAGAPHAPGEGGEGATGATGATGPDGAPIEGEAAPGAGPAEGAEGAEGADGDAADPTSGEATGAGGQADDDEATGDEATPPVIGPPIGPDGRVTGRWYKVPGKEPGEEHEVFVPDDYPGVPLMPDMPGYKGDKGARPELLKPTRLPIEGTPLPGPGEKFAPKKPALPEEGAAPAEEGAETPAGGGQGAASPAEEPGAEPAEEPAETPTP